MDLTPEQRKIAKRIVRIGRKRGESRREIKAALETGLVESNLKNLSYGDADSAGWRQERASLYKNPTNVKASVNRFYDETSAVEDQYSRAGDLAAAVQRPAAQYRGRYQERAGEADQILKQLGGMSGRGGSRPVQKRDLSAASPASYGAPSFESTPGVDNTGLRQSLMQGYLADRGKPDALLSLAAGLQGAQDVDPTTTLVPGKKLRRSGGGSTLVIGDSLGVGTAPKLERLLGGKVVADVKEGRTSDRGVRRLADALQQGGAYDRIVLDLGTNDQSARELKQSIREAQQIAGGVPVFVATVRGPGAKRKNEMLRSLDGVTVVDWARKSNRRDGLVAGDGVHATDEGYAARARQFARAMGVQPATRQRGGGKGGRGPYEIAELFWQGPNGINIKNGEKVPQGFVDGHTGHVHVAAGPKGVIQLGKLAQEMGLTVRENPYFDPVDPVHTEGSFHYQDRAIDVSGDPAAMAEFAHKVARMRKR